MNIKNVSRKSLRSYRDVWSDKIPTLGNYTSRKRIRIWDLFSGVGGLSTGVKYGLLEQGHPVAVSVINDIDKNALDVNQLNSKAHFTVSKSIAELVSYGLTKREDEWYFSSDPILDSSLLNLPNPDLIIAGPPCQGHSMLNNHSRGSDPKNELYIYPAVVGIALNTPHIVIENVVNVTKDKSSIVQRTISLLKSYGYNITDGVLNLNEFGWPQSRSRYFILASKSFKPKLSDLNRYKNEAKITLSEIFEKSKLLTSDAVSDLSPENKERIEYLFSNNLFDLPNNERPKCHQAGTTYKSSYGRIKLDGIAPTITTGFLSPGRGRFIHPLEKRTLSLSEASLIQSFPLTYNWDLENQSKVQVAKWIGNAVPPLFGYYLSSLLRF